MKSFLGLFLLYGLVASASAELPLIKGRVVVDENANGRIDNGELGLKDVAVTDGVQVVLTDDGGRFAIQLEPEEVIPFTPARTIAVSWPSHYWPQGRWYYRVSEIKGDDTAEFLLVRQDQKLPIGIVQGTDPHDCFRREFNNTWRDDVERMGKLVDLAVVTGDLSYISRENADKDLGDVRKFTDAFPVPMFHAPGNHDIADIHTANWNEPHDLAGNGGFTKHLGPVRWSFDYAGVHLVGIDWARPVGQTLETGMPNVAVDWLERDLARLPEGTRTFLFAHQFWSPNPKLLEIARQRNIELMLGGHSHRNIDLSSGEVKMITTMSLSKLLHIYPNRHELVDFCQGYRPGTPDYHGKYCHLDTVGSLAARRGEPQKIGLQHLTAEGMKLTGDAVGPGLELATTLRFDVDRKVIVRLISSDDAQRPIDLTLWANQIECEGLTTTAGRRPTDEHYKLQLLLDHGGLEVKVNGRVYFCRENMRPGGTWDIVMLAPQGGALLADAAIWPMASGDAEMLAKVAVSYQGIYQAERAAAYWRAILAQDPDHTAANFSLGKWLYERGRGELAEPHLKKAAQHEAHRREVSLLLAQWYDDFGREVETAAMYQKMLAAAADLEVKNKLAWLYLTAHDEKVRDPKLAVKLARELCRETKEQNPWYLETLCAALEEVGETQAALDAANLAFERVKEQSGLDDRLLRENMRTRIKALENTLANPAP